jgi:hypothetical protein
MEDINPLMSLPGQDLSVYSKPNTALSTEGGRRVLSLLSSVSITRPPGYYFDDPLSLVDRKLKND